MLVTQIDRPRGAWLLAGLELEASVRLFLDRSLILLGDSEQHADGPHRQRFAEVLHEVEAVGILERFERAAVERGTCGSIAVHLLRREHSCHQATVQIVYRRILEQDQARRDGEIGPDELEDRALARAICIPLDQALLDVSEAAQGIEVVLLVVVERCLVLHPFPQRIRIGVDVEAVRVVVDVGHVKVISNWYTAIARQVACVGQVDPSHRQRQRQNIPHH